MFGLDIIQLGMGAALVCMLVALALVLLSMRASGSPRRLLTAGALLMVLLAPVACTATLAEVLLQADGVHVVR